MKITLIGYWKNNYYEKSLQKGLEYNDIKVDKLVVHKKTKYNFYYNKSYTNQIIKRIQFFDNKILFFWQCNEISNKVFIKLKKLNYTIIQYHNDSVFNYKNLSRFIKFYRYRQRITYCDLVLYYRRSDKNYLEKNNTDNDLLPPFYNSEIHYETKEEKNNDVIFIGHYEKDNRDEFINYIFENSIKIFIAGPAHLWKYSKVNSVLKNQIKGIYDNDYRIAVNRSKLGICFLSKLNSDDYTRRCFEFPACGTPVIMPKTNQLLEIFGEKYQFFSTKDELLSIIKFYLKNPKERKELLNWQKKVIRKFEVSEIALNLSKKLVNLNLKNNTKILFHHPSLTTYRLFFFRKINEFYSNVNFVFNYSNLKDINKLKNSNFLSKHEWVSTSGKLIFNINLFRRPDKDLLITSDHVNLPEILLFTLYYLFNKKIFIWSAINKKIYDKKNFFKKKYLNFIYTKCDLILCINSQNKIFINNILKINKTIILPNTTINFANSYKENNLKGTNFNHKNNKLNIKNKFKNILYVGRIEESKGIILLFEAIKKLDFKNYNLILVGKNNLSNKILNKYKNLNLLFFDEVKIEDLNKFYLIADIFVFPSLEDTWGMVINEVFAYDCVVICSKFAGCYPDLVNEKNAFCFNPLNINELSNFIKIGLENKESYIFRKNKDIKLIEFSLDNQLKCFNDAVKKFL